MVLLYVLCLIAGVALMVFHEQLAESDPDTPAAFWIIYAAVIAVMGVVFSGAFVATFFLPRAHWAWIYHLILIALGMTSCCCLPVCIPLLIFWIRPETRAWFQDSGGGAPVAATGP